MNRSPSWGRPSRIIASICAGVPPKAAPRSRAARWAHRTYSPGVHSCLPPLSPVEKRARPAVLRLLIGSPSFRVRGGNLMPVGPDEVGQRVREGVLVLRGDL